MPQASRLRVEVFTSQEVQEVHRATLDVLENVGVVFQAPSALDVLKDAGCRVDFSSGRVCFPPDLVESALRKPPHQVALYGRDGRPQMLLGDGHTYFAPNALAVNVLDLEGTARPARLEDVAALSRLADALPHIHEGHGSVQPRDVPDEVAHAHAMLAMFQNTAKPFKGRGWGVKQARDSIRMAEVVAGGAEALRARPFIFRNVNSVSPLAQGKELVEGALEYVRAGLPLIITPEIQFGGTGPITLAGALVQQNAEILSFLTLAQAVRPGAPVIYGTVSSAMDMRRGSLPYAAVEAFLFNMMTAQMARFYGLPSRGSGGVSDAHAVDAQAGLDSALGIWAATLGGISYVQGPGGLSSSLTTCYAKLVMDDEIVAMTERMAGECPVDDNSLALATIREVGPLGTYLDKRHTMVNLRAGALFHIQLLGRESAERWREMGSPDLFAVAQAKAAEILRTHQVPSLLPEVERELLAMVRNIEQREACER